MAGIDIGFHNTDSIWIATDTTSKKARYAACFLNMTGGFVSNSYTSHWNLYRRRLCRRLTDLWFSDGLPRMLRQIPFVRSQALLLLALVVSVCTCVVSNPTWLKYVSCPPRVHCWCLGICGNRCFIRIPQRQLLQPRHGRIPLYRLRDPILVPEDGEQQTQQGRQRLSS